MAKEKKANRKEVTIVELKEHYLKNKNKVKNRLNDFSRFYNENVSWFLENDELILKNVDKDENHRIFEEICFCILTANGSALSGIRAIELSRDVLINGSVKEIQEKLKKSGVRFHNRALYIFENREFLKKNFNFEIKSIIEKMKNNKQELRQFFVKNIKGFGYKEASHFLRNIGIKDYTILDKHILNCLKELNIINEVPKTLTKKKYLEIEEKFLEFSKKMNININELDLIFWSLKTGKILK